MTLLLTQPTCLQRYSWLLGSTTIQVQNYSMEHVFQIWIIYGIINCNYLTKLASNSIPKSLLLTRPILGSVWCGTRFQNFTELIKYVKCTMCMQVSYILCSEQWTKNTACLYLHWQQIHGNSYILQITDICLMFIVFVKLS